MKKNKIVLILGASSDIGIEVVKKFLDSGWEVIAHYNKNKKVFNSSYFLYKKIRILKADLSKENQLNIFIKKIKNIKIDSLVNMVGYINNYDFNKSDIQSKIKSLMINVISPIEIIKNILNEMRTNKFGRILNISSVGVKFGGSKYTYDYSFSKHALEYISFHMKEMNRFNILTNNLRIGVVNTKLLRKVRNKNIKSRVKLIPMKRMGDISEVTKMIYFLSSEENSYISCQTISISGGE